MDNAQPDLNTMDHSLRVIWDTGNLVLDDEMRISIQQALLEWLGLSIELPVEPVLVQAVALFLRPTLSKTHESYQESVKKRVGDYADARGLLHRIHNAAVRAWHYVAQGGLGVDTVIPMLSEGLPLGTQGLFVLGEGLIRVPELYCCEVCDGLPPDSMVNRTLGTYVGWHVGALIAIQKLDGWQCHRLEQDSAVTSSGNSTAVELGSKVLRTLIAPWGE